MPDPGQSSQAAATEQVAVTRMYERLDELAERTARDLTRTRRSPTAGTPAALVEREALLRTLTERLGSLTSAERRLCFGRLDFSAGDRPLYIGRLSLAEESQELILTDWRAPAAAPFYRATTAEPMGVTRRRHILLEGRRVSAVEDDVLDLASVDDTQRFEGSGALMAALAARRTGRMGDIVATIQAEQDQIIRAPLPGILVVEGGPGCGKTVVGLHRAAFLLYTYRDRIARSGVLVVGPNSLFLRYISQVLPGLGEASAVLATPGRLYPGLDTDVTDSDPVAAVKGDLAMAGVIANAVRARQRVPQSAKRLDVAGTRISLTPGMAAGARDRARASRKPHNAARVTFVVSLLDRLAAALATARRVDLETNRDILIGDLRDSADVRREVNLCWMPLTPQQLLADLYARPELLTQAGERLSARQRALLSRPRTDPWTVSDVPLLDEAAELLGQDDEPARRAAALAASERAMEAEYAKGVLAMTGVTTVGADDLIRRYSPASATRMSAADAGHSDRTWTFGHVVVDEAQELSPMQWRLLMRRCPTRSMTVVGDLAQATTAGAPRTWADVFDDMARGRWSLRSLSVNYRTPAPVMALAASVLLASGAQVTPPRSARDGQKPRIVSVSAGTTIEGGLVPGRRSSRTGGGGQAGGGQVGVGQAGVGQAGVGRVGDGQVEESPLTGAVCEVVSGVAGSEGRSAVICSRSMVALLAAALSQVLPSGTLGVGSGALDTRVSLLDPVQAKGLEFDQVVVVEPGAILAASERGAHDLYVALTRATAQLTVVHEGPLPAGFSSAGAK